MAIKKMFAATFGGYEFDDTDLVEDPDGDFTGQTLLACVTDSQASLGQDPTDDTHVLRMIEYRKLFMLIGI